MCVCTYIYILDIGYLDQANYHWGNYCQIVSCSFSPQLRLTCHLSFKVRNSRIQKQTWCGGFPCLFPNCFKSIFSLYRIPLLTALSCVCLQIERTLFEDTVKTLNNYYAEAEKIGGQSYLEGCLACATAYLIFLCMETRYEKVRLSDLQQDFHFSVQRTQRMCCLSLSRFPFRCWRRLQSTFRSKMRKSTPPEACSSQIPLKGECALYPCSVFVGVIYTAVWPLEHTPQWNLVP